MWPSCSITSGAVAPTAKSRDAKVRRSECGVRPSGSGARSRACETLVGAADRAVEDAVADVARALAAPVVVPNTSALGFGLVLAFSAASSSRSAGRSVDLARPGVGLGLAHAQPAAGEVDVAPAQREQLAEAQAGEGERGEDRPPRQPAIATRLAVELAGGVEQRLDVLGAVEIRRGGLGLAQLAPTAVDAHGFRAIKSCSSATSRI